jgi:hypothetical protein
MSFLRNHNWYVELSENNPVHRFRSNKCGKWMKMVPVWKIDFDDSKLYRKKPRKTSVQRLQWEGRYPTQPGGACYRASSPDPGNKKATQNVRRNYRF